DERRQHGRIDQALALFKCPERGFQHRKQLRAHRDIPAAAGVQARQLTVGEEAGEARLGVAYPCLATFKRSLSAAETEQLAGGAQGVEVSGLQLTRHGSHSGRMNRSATP